MLDIANPLDSSAGFPACPFRQGHGSIAEQVQRAFPEVKVVKALTAALRVDAKSLGQSGA